MEMMAIILEDMTTQGIIVKLLLELILKRIMTSIELHKVEIWKEDSLQEIKVEPANPRSQTKWVVVQTTEAYQIVS